MESESVNAVAKATEEVAKTSGKIVDAASKLGGFVGDLIVEPLREITGTWTDNLRARRAENYIDLQLRVRAKLEALGPEARLRQVPMRVGIPLLEAATIEEEPALRDRWATMLANFANESSGVEVHMSFVAVLAEMTPLEVAIIDRLFSIDREGEQLFRQILTVHLPEEAYFAPSGQEIKTDPPSSDVAFALSNLRRLGVITMAATFGGGEMLRAATRTVFGRALYRACTSPADLPPDQKDED